MKLDQRTALLGTADKELTSKLVLEVGRSGREWLLAVASDLGGLRTQLSRIRPRVILLDESVLSGTAVGEVLGYLTASAPVILLASLERQAQVTQLVAEGDLDCVIRAGDFIPLAVALVERRMRWLDRTDTSLFHRWLELPPDLGEVLRHEINNPLTGILGNAELVLAHRDRLPPAAAQRLETVIELSVRLRETVRRLSTAWESQHFTAPLA